MKRTLMILALICLLASTAFAGFKEFNTAYIAKDYATALAEVDKVITDGTASVTDKANAYLYKGYCYYMLKQFETAIPEFQKVLSDYSRERRLCVKAQLYIGDCYKLLKQFDEAILELQKVSTDYPKERTLGAVSYRHIGYCHECLNNDAKSQEAYIKVLADYPDVLGTVKLVFDKVNFFLLSEEEAITILKTVRRATPVPLPKILGEKNLDGTPTEKAKQAQATLDFLGKVGGEIGKLD